MLRIFANRLGTPCLARAGFARMSAMQGSWLNDKNFKGSFKFNVDFHPLIIGGASLLGASFTLNQFKQSNCMQGDFISIYKEGTSDEVGIDEFMGAVNKKLPTPIAPEHVEGAVKFMQDQGVTVPSHLSGIDPKTDVQGVSIAGRALVKAAVSQVAGQVLEFTPVKSAPAVEKPLALSFQEALESLTPGQNEALDEIDKVKFPIEASGHLLPPRGAVAALKTAIAKSPKRFFPENSVPGSFAPWWGTPSKKRFGQEFFPVWPDQASYAVALEKFLLLCSCKLDGSANPAVFSYDAARQYAYTLQQISSQKSPDVALVYDEVFRTEIAKKLGWDLVKPEAIPGMMAEIDEAIMQQVQRKMAEGRCGFQRPATVHRPVHSSGNWEPSAVNKESPPSEMDLKNSNLAAEFNVCKFYVNDRCWARDCKWPHVSLAELKARKSGDGGRPVKRGRFPTKGDGKGRR